MVPTEGFTKVESRKLRELAGLAYERELSAGLRELDEDFAKWRANSINAFDLSDAIHEFHNGLARELWSLYSRLKPPTIVRSALERGVLVPDDVPPKLLAKLHARTV